MGCKMSENEPKSKPITSIDIARHSEIMQAIDKTNKRLYFIEKKLEELLKRK